MAMADIDLFLQGKGIPHIVIAKVPEGGRVQDIIEAARSHGFETISSDHPLVFLEDQEEPLSSDEALLTVGIRPRARVHVHVCPRVRVTVNFNGVEKSHPFSPASTVAAVKKWATHEFQLRGVDATEHALQTCGGDVRPPEDTHIGRLVVTAACVLCFDLVPKQRVEG